MCSRKEAQRAREAQDAAAEALTRACNGICTNHIDAALQTVYRLDANEELPAKFYELLRGLK